MKDTTTTIKWDGSPIPRELWGSSHLSTLLYIESRIVDADGQPYAAQMRTKKSSLRRGVVVGELGRPLTPSPGKEYPTRLAQGEVTNHDDWDCADDLETAGFLEWGGTGMYPIFKLTNAGWLLAGRVRRHLGERPNGTRTYAGFEVVPMVASQTKLG